MLEVLKDYINANDSQQANKHKNNIVSDYYNYLLGIESDVMNYKHTNPKDWSGNAWRGFYAELQKNHFKIVLGGI